MKKLSHGNAKDSLLAVATELFRRNGYGATSVDQICEAAGVSKGAFFHHFPSKQAIGVGCLQKWQQSVGAMFGRAGEDVEEDPVQRLFGTMDLVIRFFSNAKMIKSCLAGTTVQEVAESDPVLRDAANACFLEGEKKFAALLKEAAKRQKVKLDASSLASLWDAALQGSLILAKASQDGSMIPGNLLHVRNYIRGLLNAKDTSAKRASS